MQHRATTTDSRVKMKQWRNEGMKNLQNDCSSSQFILVLLVITFVPFVVKIRLGRTTI